MLIKRFAKPQKAFTYAFLLLFLVSSLVLPFINPTVAFAANPDQPTNSSPANLATDISVTPTLQSSNFSDSDGGDTHKSSQWQVSTGTGGGFIAGIVYDSGTDATNRTSIEIPAGALASGTVHYWQVRHQDNNNDWSSYSLETSFTTTVTVSPNAPTNISPANGTTSQSTTPTLTSSTFSDPDGGDTHSTSRWRISTISGNYSSPVYDSGTDAVNLTSVSVPVTLALGTAHYWQVRHQDNNGNWSAWSAEVSFTTWAKPNTPTNTTPADSTPSQSTTLTLTSSDFSDPDDSDTHQASQWQISDTIVTTPSTVSLEFKDNNPLADTIERTTGSFVTDGWVTGMNITVTGSASNNNTYIVDTVTALIITLTPAAILANEGPGAGATLSGANYASPVYDSGTDTTNLTSIAVPLDRLNTDATYYWQVRHQDNNDVWSDWSAEFSFGTLEKPNTPTNHDPVSGVTNVSLTPILESSAFSDPDAGDIHSSSRWQISDTAGNYSSPAYDSGIDSTNKISITVPTLILQYSTKYYWRVSYQDDHGIWSNWSADTSFTTLSSGDPSKPTNVSPADNETASITPTLTGSAFSDPDVGDTHQASRWQISDTFGDYSSPVYDSGVDGDNTTSIDISTGFLSYSDTYYWRVQYQDSYNQWSAWSVETSFQTVSTDSPNTPSNTSPAGSATDVDLTLILQSSPFSDPNAGDTHAASQWRISDTSSDYTSPVYDSGVNGDSKTSINIPINTLLINMGYYWQVRYQDSYDNWSAWSTETSFTTRSSQAATQPTNTAPVGGATDVTLTPILVSSAFADPDVGDDHEASQWQVATDIGFTSLVYDSSVAAASTQLSLPAGLLNVSTQYYWRVKYQDSYSNWSSYSTETSFTTIAMLVPNTPTNTLPANAATGASTTPTLTSSDFSDPDVGDTHDASQWQISTGTGGTFDANIVYDSGTDTSDKTSIIIPASNLDYNTQYYWQVKYQDSYGNWSAYSTETSFDTVASGNPNTPSNTSPANGTTDIELAPRLFGSVFSDPDAGDTHTFSQWQIASDTGFTTVIYDSGVSSNLIEFTVPSALLNIDTAYWWRVRYRDSFGNWSSWSTGTSFTTIDVLSPLTPINDLPAVDTTGASTTPTLTSSAFSDPDIGDTHSASQWQVSTDDLADFVANILYDSSPTVDDLDYLTVPSGELSYNTIYYWRVKHIDSFGKASAWSTETKFTTAASPNPTTPVNTAPAGGATDVTLTPMLKSSAFADPDIDNIDEPDYHEASHWQISTDDLGDFVANIMYDSSPTVDDLDELEIQSGTLTNSTTYYWRIRHQDSFSNWSLWSTATPFTTIAWHLPDKPTNLAPVDGGTDIILTPTLITSAFHDADALDDHIASRWQVASDAGFTTIIYDSNVNTDNLTDIEIPSAFLAYDETYFWRVRYQDSSSQWSAWSDEFEFDSIATSAPVRPTNLAPTAGASGVGIRPTLNASAFNDPDQDDTHTASQWQLTDTSGDYTDDVIIYDSGVDPTNLTGVVISVLLDYNTIYYWQVRYKDSHDNWSTYSPETQFSTLASVKPSQPVISSPVTGTTVPSTTPTIQASVFEDADIGDTHKASKWQISATSGEYATPLYDSEADTTNLISITIPEDELSEDTTYYLHVSYQDNFDNWSDWSAEISFKTTGAAANFSPPPTSAAANQNVIFRDTSTGDVTAWEWDFGDGATVGWTTETRPAGGQITHAYTTEGTFTVSLEITTATGTDKKTLSNYITVGGAAAGGGDSMTTTWIIIGALAALAALGGVFYYMRKQREG